MSNEQPYTLNQALKLASALEQSCGGYRVNRLAAEEIWGISVAFDLLRAAKPGIGVPSGFDFRNNFSTTLGNRIYLCPSVLSDPIGLTVSMVHECQHVRQWFTGAPPQNRNDGFPWPSEVAFPILYLKDPLETAKWEADAYAAGESVARRLGGSPRTVSDVVALMRSSYRCGPAAADLAADVLESHWTAIRSHGRVNVWAATQAHQLLDQLSVL